MRYLLFLAFLIGFSHGAVGQGSGHRLAIDANEKALTATLTYRGANVEIFGYADGLDLSHGRLAISIIGPEVPQELRIIERNALGLVTQGAPKSFVHLPGFWSLHATPGPDALVAATYGEFERLPSPLIQWAVETSRVNEADNEFGGNAMQAQLLAGKLSVHNQVNLRSTGLFNTTLTLPASAPVGSYKILAHWFDQDGSHLVSESKSLIVSKGTIARWIETTSQKQALFYGLICVLVAIAGGLLSELVFRRFAP